MRRFVATLSLVAALAFPTAAAANGDPAADVLLLQDAYFPYAPKVPKPLEDALKSLLEQSRNKGYPLKVAVIATPNDLGAVPQFFGNPQLYATHLQSEIAFNKAKPLLIVMPGGFGTAEAGEGAAKALEDLDRPDPESGDSMGRTAIEATLRLAKAQGKPLAKPRLPPAPDDGGTSPAVYLVPVLLLALGGGLAALRTRGRDDEAAA